MPDGLRSVFGATAALTLALVAQADLPASGAGTITVQGSSTFSGSILTPNRVAIEAIAKQSLNIVSIRSDIGLLRLLAGHADFAVISSSLNYEIDSLKVNNPNLPYGRLMAFPVTQVRVAFAVNPRNPVRKVDLQFIRQVLSGEPTNWRDIGGPNLPVRAAYVQGGGGVTLSVAGQLFDGRPFTPVNPIRVSFGTQVIKVVEQEPRALGIAQLRLVREHQLPELMTDQVIEQKLSLVTLGEPTSQQQAVIKAVQQVAADLGMPVVK